MVTAQSPTARTLPDLHGMGLAASPSGATTTGAGCSWMLAAVAIIGLAQWAGPVDNNFALPLALAAGPEPAGEPVPAQKGHSADVVLRSPARSTAPSTPRPWAAGQVPAAPGTCFRRAKPARPRRRVGVG